MTVFTGYHMGECPKCKGKDLAYGDSGWNGDGEDGDGDFWKNVECENCGLKFVEWYELRYAESVSYENEEGDENGS